MSESDNLKIFGSVGDATGVWGKFTCWALGAGPFPGTEGIEEVAPVPLGEALGLPVLVFDVQPLRISVIVMNTANINPANLVHLVNLTIMPSVDAIPFYISL